MVWQKQTGTVLIAAGLIWMATEPARPSELTTFLETLRSVGKEGAGNEDAARAWRNIVNEAKADQIPELLRGMKYAKPLGANWIRSAIDSIVEKAKAEGSSLPEKELEKFLFDLEQHPRSRRLAFELITQTNPAAKDRLVPRMLNDPSVELRREAVSDVLNAADGATEKEIRIELYRKALDSARDLDQITTCTKNLRNLGLALDLPRYFGFLMKWHVIGPFDNSDKAGFAATYPPEKRIDLDAEYQGKKGALRWKAHETKQEHGVVDFNKLLGRDKGVVGYAYQIFEASESRDIEFRLATVSAWKLWVNGELLFERDEYHHGTRIDHYKVKAHLGKGRNSVLLKVCQNEQPQDYADHWRFQIRVCDSLGSAVLAKNRVQPKSLKNERPSKETSR